MKAHIPLSARTRKEIERQTSEYATRAYAEAQAKLDAQKDDIAKRAMYLALLCGNAVGLSARTLQRMQAALPDVTDRYAEYRTDEVADEWARVTLQAMGVAVAQTEEQI